MPAGKKPLDLLNRKFGSLLAIEYAGDGSWLCKCDCGNTRIVNTTRLLNGTVTKCKVCTGSVQPNLINKTFGNWLVVSRHSSTTWKCTCNVCGTQKIINGSELIGGRYRGCTDCINRSRLIDIKGKRFGKWEVLEYAGDHKWKCRCKCGNTGIVESISLRNSLSTQCRECAGSAFKDITGMTFGKWTPIEYVGNSIWRCRCQCGTVKDIQRTTLVSGNSIRCMNCFYEDRREDLTSQVFEHMKVVRHLSGQKWRCKCSCGNLYDAYGYDIKRGRSLVCPQCSGKPVLKDIRHQRFGNWFVLDYQGNSKWLCQCDCGNIGLVESRALRLGKSTKCINCAGSGFDDLTNKRFGSWKVLTYDGNKLWKCQCDCGTVKLVYGQSLKQGKSTSCGCKLQENRKKSLFERYGDISFIKAGTRSHEQINALRSKENLEKWIKDHFEYNPTIPELANSLNVGEASTLVNIHKYELENLVDINPKSSKYERELAAFISSIYSGRIECNVKGVIGKKELDIYLPDIKLAVEFNGNFWHSDYFRDKYYHKDKTEISESNGIHLVHVFEYEWVNPNLRVKIEKLLSSYVCNKRPLHARGIVIRSIDGDLANKFLDEYHLQSGVPATYYYGAFEGDKLIGVATFGKSRFATDFDYELLRLCWLPDVAVSGGFEKFVSTFIRDTGIKSLGSYVSKSKFSGKSYERIFNHISDSEPGYVWVNPENNDVVTRYMSQKQRLLNDGLGIYGETEDEIMRNLGFLKIYDSGNSRFILKSDYK